MSDVKIMREHRLAALQALGWSDAAKAEAWLESGGDTLTHANKFVGRHVTSMVEESAVALAIAQAEHRARAAVIADLRELLESAHSIDRIMDYIEADSIRSLIKTLEEP